MRSEDRKNIAKTHENPSKHRSLQRSPCARQNSCKSLRFGLQKQRSGRPGESPVEQNRGRTGQVRAQNASGTHKNRPRAPAERKRPSKIEKARRGAPIPAASYSNHSKGYLYYISVGDPDHGSSFRGTASAGLSGLLRMAKIARSGLFGLLQLSILRFLRRAGAFVCSNLLAWRDPGDPQDVPGLDFGGRNGCFFEAFACGRRSTHKTSDIEKVL